jgi:cation diffusion facilitator CzcD-associated flavoprotein CzcO
MRQNRLVMAPAPGQVSAMAGDALDVLIVGAGISGISMAAHLKRLCPERRFAMLERRADLGGTWDLFRYPGVRSDSDMPSLGFRFAAWEGDQAIAGGEAIRDYLRRVVREYGIEPHIRFGTKVVAADWREGQALWRVTVEDDDGRRELAARFLYLASGYYDYDAPHDAALPGIAEFAGPVVHPQFWPQDLDYGGKR